MAKDKVLATLIEKYGELPPLSLADSMYQSLTKSIVSQQLSTTAAATIYKRFEQRLDGDVSPANVLSVEDTELRALGFSGQKARYVKEVANYWTTNPRIEQDIWHMKDDDIVKSLTSIKGVGEWTVQMILIFGLDRPDVLPLGDLIVRKGIIHHYGLDETDKKVLDRCKDAVALWRPYASYGSRYMWLSKDMMIKPRLPLR